jgi:hypothetical protein
MTKPRLNNSSLMCIENDILENIDFNDIIHEFSTSKCRKHLCNLVPVIGVVLEVVVVVVVVFFLKCGGVTHYPW